MFSTMHGAPMRRSLFMLAMAALALIGTADRAESQARTTTARARSSASSRDTTRVRRERLLIRFDSLRNAFETERMSPADRQALAEEMHATIMALQESLDDVGIRIRSVDPERLARGEQLRGSTMVFSKRADPTRGYLGVSFDGPSVDDIRGSERIIRFLDYPRIALVEPSSPAERAGILQGDTLIELNGSDVRDRAISLTKLLVPQQRVRMRVRRDGSPMDFRVTVAEAPPYMVSRMAPVPPMIAMTPMPAPMPTPPARVRVYASEAPQAVPAPPSVAATPAPPVAMTWVMQDGIAGARLETITEGLGRALGTQYGVLVLRAAPGTPAFDSGLRDGDVILKVDGDAVRTVRDLREAIQGVDDDAGVKLIVLRDRKQREVTLRWRW
jgi:predicted metalloprotease with PDZ domain